MPELAPGQAARPPGGFGGLFPARPQAATGDPSHGLRVAAATTFALLVAFAAVIAFGIAYEFQRAAQSRDLLTRSFETRAQTQSVFSLLQDAETGQRGFIITGDVRFLEPYESAVDRLDAQMRQLRALLAGSEPQIGRMDRMQAIASDKLAEMHRGIEAREANRRAEAMRIVASGRGRALMDQIRQIVARMTASEATEVAARIREADNRSSRAAWLTVLAIVGSLVVTAGASVLVFSHLNRRRQAELAMQRQEQLIELMKEVAEDANAAEDFDDALGRIFRGFTRALQPRRGLVARFDPASGNPVALGRQPEEPDLAPAAEALTTAWSGRNVALSGSASDPGRLRRLDLLVRDGDQPAGFLRLEGLDRRLSDDALLAVAQYAASQLARAAERARILTTLGDALSRLEAVFNSAIDGIVTRNASGSIESFNPAAERLFGVRAEDVLRRHFSRLIEASDAELATMTAVMRTDLRGRGSVRELVGRRGDGTTFAMDVAMNVMRLGDRRLFLGVIRDISERKRVEQMKSEFVSTVSHELRTPLTSIAGSLGLLAGGVAGALPERAGKLIGIAHANSQRLVRLINDILDIEKIESGEMSFDLQPVSLSGLIEQTVEANRGFAEGYGVRIVKGPAQGTVLADADRLAQVATNLLSNAIKFSPRGGTVDVSATAHGGGYRLTVRDRGPGIPEAFRARMFTRFAQADGTDTRRKGGTGLGLSIVREIVLRLGGMVSFAAAPGGGTAFHVDLPRIREVDQSIRNEASCPAVQLAGGRPEAARQLEEALARAGFEIDRAASAATVKAFAASRSYAIILVDMGLPDQDGIGLIREMRAAGQIRGAPILILSSDPDLACGPTVPGDPPVFDWLHRPVDAEALVKALAGILRSGVEGQPRVLHVDDDPDVLEVVAAAFGARARLIPATTLQGARSALDEGPFDLVILDLGLADGSGLDLLPWLKREGAATPVVVFSAQDAHPDVVRKVDATLTKSRATLNDLVDTVEALVDAARSREAEVVTAE